VHAERREGLDQVLRSEVRFEQPGFDERDAVLAPRGIGELVDELGLGGSGRTILVKKLLDVAVEGGEVFAGQNRALSS
jgi:hypothetical protein